MDSRSPEDLNDPPPLLGRWSRLYGLLVVQLAVLTLLFYALGRWAS